MKRILKPIIVLLIIIAIPIGVSEIFLRYAFYTGINRIISDPDGDGSEIEEAKAFLSTCEDAYILSDDGLRLHAYFYNKNNSGKYLITMHGYKDTALYNGIFYRYMAKHGYDVLVLDVRGHGKSEGVWLSMGEKEKDDLLLWIEYIRGLDEDAKIVLHGISMGGATVMLASGENPENVVAAIEDSGYSSVYDEFEFLLESHHIPSKLLLKMTDLWCRIRLGLSFSAIRPVDAVKKTTIPMLFIHGSEDTFVPTWMVYPCYENHRGPKELWIAKESVHARCMDEYKDEYNEKCFSFVERFM